MHHISILSIHRSIVPVYVLAVFDLPCSTMERIGRRRRLYANINEDCMRVMIVKANERASTFPETMDEPEISASG